MTIPVIGPILQGIGGLFSILTLVLQVIRLLPELAKTIREIIEIIRLLKQQGRRDEAAQATQKMREGLRHAKETEDGQPLKDLRDELRNQARQGVGTPPQTKGLD